MNDELRQCREQIDRIDDELLELFNRRAKLAQQIGHAKGESAVLRPEREAQILRRLTAANPGPLPNEGVTRLFTEVMSNCRALEAPISVAYLGPVGTYSEDAARKRFGGACHFFAVPSISDVFSIVERQQIQFGVVPVENSTEGAIGITLDLLLQTPLKVCGEVLLPVHHCLMASHSDLSAIETVFSHPQSLAQCQNWLAKNLPSVDRMPVASNAEAASRAASQKVSGAAIASKRAGELRGLNILAENIEDDPRNTTRFLVIGNQQVAPSGRDKTSLVMSAANRPGAVHDLLVPLAKHGVSMTRLESRPARSGLWEYVFYVDIEGHQADAKVAAALGELQQAAAFVKILGSYPAAD